MILEVDNIHCYYGLSHVLHGVSLKVDAGEIVSLLGRNGAGKTTTILSIMGLVRPRSGKFLATGTPSEVEGNALVQEAYFGFEPSHHVRRAE